MLHEIDEDEIEIGDCSVSEDRSRSVAAGDIDLDEEDLQHLILQQSRILPVVNVREEPRTLKYMRELGMYPPKTMGSIFSFFLFM